MGILGRLFNSGGRSATRQRMTTAEAEKIIKAYGAAVMSKKDLYADVSELPYPKVKIKEAFLIGIVATQDEKARTLLRNGYVTLADWQEGIGPGATQSRSCRPAGRDNSGAGKTHFRSRPRIYGTFEKGHYEDASAARGS